ncbi:tetratricopeptide repeat protein [Nostoc sp. TCL26-01]|uniref:CHAT domain-containing protein n=1 Tax=Nostoc sp. TCL26-01 TaxID=2576904 RepID=UPI0015C0876F|nr:tetratricopeptide repeat protein [Nostoc sp. TCL26-01]QLE55188.1 tetratricopeptide repeat protein [Nostoc sp. TCL26-01]
MLTRLLHWLKTFDKHPVDYQQAGSFKGVKEEVAEEPPALTNGDLELLFTQLLAGVHQGRGQQWAIKYLQRMEDRIGLDRWIDWLLVFGEKLLLSPAPNHQLATQMVQLGELGIGKVGELSYDIGIQLLNREFEDLYEVDEESETSITEEETSATFSDSPGQELIRSLGELLWESQEPEVIPTTIESIAPNTDDTLEENTIKSLQELNWGYQPEFVVTATDDAVIENLQELSWGYLEDFVATADASPTENLQELSWESPEELTTPTPALLMPAQEDVISNLSELVLEHRGQNSVSSAIVSVPGNWDQSLVNIDPHVAYTLDELLVRLDQSANLVQQLAANLVVQANQVPVITTEKSTAFIQAQALFYQGLQQAKSGNLSGAIALYEQAIQLHPNSYEYWFNRGLTLFHLERFSEAIASYDQAIELKPDYYKAWYNRGGTLGQLGLFDEAIASFKQAIAIQSDMPEAWSSKAWAELKLGHIAEAIASYEQALNLQPEDQENWYYRGIALGIDEQYEQAIASYDKALEIQPDFHEVWIDRGVVLFNLKQWSNAIASWDQALSIQPDFYLAWYNRGIALDNLGHREEAIASYKQAIAIKPDFHLAWYNQAVALFYLERYLEAIVGYDNVLQIKPDYWEAWIGRGTAIGSLDHPETPLNLITTVATNNPDLQQAGYEGKLASYQEGLKHIRPDTHPEGWGRLHLAIGNTYYEQGKQNSTSRNYWRKAVSEYNQALLTLTSTDFSQLHIEVLQSLVKALLGLGQTTQAQELHQRGCNLLQQLLSEANRSEESKKQLALKFAGLGQLAVDIAVEYGDLVEAWEIAEQGKNSCLTWLLLEWNTDIPSLNYRSVQKLLNPHTAIIYWHLSPVALHTFIIKDQAPSPILVFTPIQDLGTNNATPLQDLPLPEATRRLIAFENWLENWQQTYQEYRSQIQDQQSKSHHPWRVQMESQLLHLKNILEIETIQQELEGITQLILVPHRDLFRLPLHVLWQNSAFAPASTPNIETNFHITYLPSIQVGLSTRNVDSWQLANQTLLSVEYPDNIAYPTFRFANLEATIISQMFSHTQRIQGKDADHNNVKDALFSNHDIFHFTGQVINHLTEPKASALILANEDRLTLPEISQGRLDSYNLVTLSACESVTNSQPTITPEYVDLVSGLLINSVPYVVSTLWTVESSASASVMIEFYRRLQLVSSPTIALAEATTWLKELTAVELTKWYEDLLTNLNPEELKLKAYLATHLYRISKMPADKQPYSHPYYWAAFIITGKHSQ